MEVINLTFRSILKKQRVVVANRTFLTYGQIGKIIRSEGEDVLVMLDNGDQYWFTALDLKKIP